MSTKNLARTAVQGGRCGHYKAERDMYANEERSASRTYLKLVERDPELADEVSPPVRTPVSACFADRLGPVTRFLNSRIAKSWAKTKSELFARFDSRTTAGRHLLHDHIVKQVDERGLGMSEIDPRRYYFNYYVDPQGCLQKVPPRYKRVPQPNEPFAHNEVIAWLAHRGIRRVGAKLYWFEPTAAKWGLRTQWYFYMGRATRLEYSFDTAIGGHYRQGKSLTKSEQAFFDSLPEYVRELILKAV